MYAVQRPFVLVECSQLQACENGALQFLGHHKLLIIWRGAQYKKTKTLRADLLAERITTFTHTHTQTHRNKLTERQTHIHSHTCVGCVRIYCLIGVRTSLRYTSAFCYMAEDTPIRSFCKVYGQAGSCRNATGPGRALLPNIFCDRFNLT